MRGGFFGGRTEVFGNPEPEDYIEHFDYTGMYSSKMVGCTYPYGPHEWIEDPKNIDHKSLHDITFKSQTNLPVLPQKIDGKLKFVNGVGRGLYGYNEIMLHLQMGGSIIKIHKKKQYKYNGYIFKEFAEHFASRRKEGRLENFFGKLTVNSVFGKIGMSDKPTETIIVHAHKYLPTLKKLTKRGKHILKESKINNIYIIQYAVQRKKGEKTYINSNVTYAILIAQNARVELYKGFMATQENGGRLLYSDTDSIFAAFPEPKNGQRHGKIK